MRLVVKRIGEHFVFALVLETFIALTHAVVGDECWYFLFVQLLEVGFAVITGVGGIEGFRLGY